MKKKKLNLRIEEELVNGLDQLAYLENKTVSAVVREAVVNHLRQHELKQLPEHYNPLELLQSLGFSELIFWVYEKRFEPANTDEMFLYWNLIDIIEEIQINPIFPDTLKAEFRKVGRELKVLTDESDYILDFSFPESLNYSELAYFMYTLRFGDLGEVEIAIK
ncbi:ribbon-helix-helix protein, CopG family [Aestuariibaculum sp. M13]|uniref:ribbon-helix-helix protein, CopG family n=1 Tax=Aestuariibaculum sp. M13 TaxID=2967132 RepID=UPI002159FF90|nr:ribbon-helix-helix protein, CopG family [Aestuariibaculum sp. M13]MCR8667413.1 ribbon-helix-helix protein, CopG family [Aestuariibaculum sp. M13]